jgi:hypothetical protein
VDDSILGLVAGSSRASPSGKPGDVAHQRCAKDRAVVAAPVRQSSSGVDRRRSSRPSEE